MSSGPRPAWDWPAAARIRLRILAARCSLAAAAVLCAWALLAGMNQPKSGPDWSAVVFDKTGRLLSARVARDGQWRFMPRGKVPERFAKAIVCFEDRRFWWHLGVDPLRVGAAILQNLGAGRVVSGASTIAMQVVRLEDGAAARTVGAKLREAVLALGLVLTTSREHILAQYAALAPFGGNVVGLEAAAWRYFGREAADLSWAEAATLAVLPNNPGLVHPGRNRERLLSRRNRLLQDLWEQGAFDRSTLDLALAEPLPAKPLPLPQKADHLLAWLEKQAAATDASRAVFTTGIDGDLQSRLQDIADKYQARLEGNRIQNVGILVMDTASGAVRAWIGNAVRGRGPEAAEFVDMVTAPRSTGSLLKPFLYAAQLDAGETLPGQLVLDIPTRVGSYMPENNVRTYAGALPAAQALSQSLNIPAVRQLRIFGLERFHFLLQSLGMGTLFRRADDYGLPLILGGAEGTLLELCGMYAALGRLVLDPDSASRGNPFFAPIVLADDQGAPLPPTYTGKAARAGVAPLSPGAAWLTLLALVEVNRPDEDGSWKLFDTGRPVAWKTGTSFGFRDAWAIGLDASWTVGVWVGNASGEGRPELKGFSAAAPLLFDVFNTLPQRSWFAEPAKYLKAIEVCQASGYPPGPYCADKIWAKVPAAAPVAQVCPWCQLVTLSQDGRFRVDSRSANLDEMHQEARMVLPPAVEYWYRRRNPTAKALPPWAPGSAAATNGGNLGLLYPEQHAQVFIPRLLDGSKGRIVAQAAHRTPDTLVYWHLDGKFVTVTREQHQVEINAAPGDHELLVVDQGGECIVRRFTVIDTQ